MLPYSDQHKHLRSDAHASHSAGKGRQPRQPRRHRQGQGRLRPQLPDPARGRARRATATAIKEFEAKRAELEKAAADKLADAQALGEKLAGRTVQITQKAGVDGRLFGSVTNADIAEALEPHGLQGREGAGAHAQRSASRRSASTPCTVALHTDVVVDVKVVVLGEDELTTT